MNFKREKTILLYSLPPHTHTISRNFTPLFGWLSKHCYLEYQALWQEVEISVTSRLVGRMYFPAVGETHCCEFHCWLNMHLLCVYYSKKGLKILNSKYYSYSKKYGKWNFIIVKFVLAMILDVPATPPLWNIMMVCLLILGIRKRKFSKRSKREQKARPRAQMFGQPLIDIVFYCAFWINSDRQCAYYGF